MNDYITAQIQQTKAYVKAFEAACQLGAMKNDGTIDKDEQKALKRINQAVKQFVRELEKV